MNMTNDSGLVSYAVSDNPHKIVQTSWQENEAMSTYYKSQFMPRLEIVNAKLALYGLETLQFCEVSFKRGWNNCYYSEREVAKIEHEIEQIEKWEEKEREIKIAKETFQPMFEELIGRAEKLGFVLSFLKDKVGIQHGNYYYAKLYNNIDLSAFIEELKQEERVIAIKDSSSNVA